MLEQQKPAIDELNAMSGLGLLATLGELPKADRKAVLAKLDDAATRRYVHAALRANLWWVALGGIGAVLLGLLATVG